MTITLPISAAWMYLVDDPDYSTIPKFWGQLWDARVLAFKKVDLLLIGPGGIQENGEFGLMNSTATTSDPPNHPVFKLGNLGDRYKKVIEEARKQNPKIKVIISQWWGSSPKWGKDFSHIGDLGTDGPEKYAQSVANFLDRWNGAHGSTAAIDGWDVDYESVNIQTYAPEVLKKIHDKLGALGRERGHQYYVCISPDNTVHLDNDQFPLAESVDFINIQSYDGGKSNGITPADYLALNKNLPLARRVKPEQILFGIDPEQEAEGKSYSIEETKAQYNTLHDSKHIAGIHVWRLNSNADVIGKEIEWNAEICKFLHP